MEEDKNKTTESDPGANKTKERLVQGRPRQDFRDLSEIDQQEGNMNNGVLGGNLEDSPAVNDKKRNDIPD